MLELGSYYGNAIVAEIAIELFISEGQHGIFTVIKSTPEFLVTAFMLNGQQAMPW
jgi:hypothetical protein